LILSILTKLFGYDFLIDSNFKLYLL